MDTGKKVVLVVVIILVGVLSLIAIVRMMNRDNSSEKESTNLTGQGESIVKEPINFGSQGNEIEKEYIKLIKEAGSSNAQNPDDFQEFSNWIAEPQNIENFREYRRKNNKKELEDCIADNIDKILKKMIPGASFGIGIRKEGDDTVILSCEETYQNDCIKNFIASNDVRAIKKASFEFDRANGAANILAFGLCSHIDNLVFPNSEDFNIVDPNNVIISPEELINDFLRSGFANIMNIDGLSN